MPVPFSSSYLIQHWLLTILAGTQFTYPGGMEGRVDLGETKMLCPPTDGHTSKY